MHESAPDPNAPRVAGRLVDSGEYFAVSQEWPTPSYSVKDWKWDEQNGWYNVDDDPATPNEAILLNEIKRLVAINSSLRQQILDYAVKRSAHQ